jgi:hypothetical protein
MEISTKLKQNITGSDRPLERKQIMNNKDYSMKVGSQELKFSIMEWKCIYNTLKQDIPEIEDNFYDSIVSNLKNEAVKLNKKLIDLRESNKDMNLYISTLKSLRETLDLINKYDWQLMYSTYGLKEEDSEKRNRVISVWEQNHDYQIRNHRIWKITDEIPNATKDDCGIKNNDLIFTRDSYDEIKSIKL